MQLPGNFKIDSWWMMLICIGFTFSVISLTTDVNLVNPSILFLFGLSLITIGISYYKAQSYKHIFNQKGILIQEFTKHTPSSILILVIGLILLTISHSLIVYTCILNVLAP